MKFITRFTGCWLRVVVVLCVVGGAACGSANAQSWTPLTGKDLGYVLHVADHPALGETFTQRCESRLQQMLQSLLGFDAKIVAVNQPPLQRWLRDHALEELTPELCRQFKLDQTEKTVVLQVSWDRGVYRLGAVEYDRHFEQVDRSHQTQVWQRELVADSLGRLALRCWSPVGRLVSRHDGSFLVHYPDAARLIAVGEWSRLKAGSVLQLYRELRTQDGIRQKPRMDQFLVVDQVTPAGFECTLAIPDIQATDTWFKHLADPQARYLVRRLTPTGGDITAKVVFKDSSVPREGCEVTVSDNPRLAARPLGQTGAGGEVIVPANSSGLLYITIQYDDQKLTKACFVGVTPSPLLFQIAARGSASDLDSEIARLEDRLRDNVAMLNDVVRQMNDAKKLNDVPKMEELLTQAEKTGNFSELKAAVTELTRKTPPTDTDSAGRLKTLLADIQQVGQQSNLGSFKTAVTTGRINVLKQQIAAAYNESRWQDASKLLEEYVQADPQDETAKDRLAELSAGLPVQDVAHRKARETIDQRRGMTRIEDLIAHWTELNIALKLVLKHKDRLWLMTAEKEFNSWSTLVSDDVEHVKKTVAAGTTSLDQAQLDDLARRAKQLEMLGLELSQTIEQCDEFLGTQ